MGPLLIPYGYDEFNKGAENLYPYHYTLEDTQRVNDEIASRTQSDVVDVDEMIAQAKAELSLEVMISLRNKAMEAYNEILKMSV